MKTPRTTNLILAAAALAWLACAVPPRAAAQRPEAQKSADEKFERGRRLYQQGDAAGAIPFLRDAAEHRKLGAADALKARMLAAAERLDAFAKAQPDNPDAEQWRDQAATLRHYGGPSGDGKSSGVYRESEVTTRAVILAKPQPGFTELARGNGVTGTVRLLAVLAADARVRYILVLKRLPDGLTEKSIEAARKIRFTPATINGQPVSQFVVLEYNFNIY